MTTVLPPAQGCRLAFDPLIPLAAPAVFYAFRNAHLMRGRETDNKTSRITFGYNWDAVPVLSSGWSSQGCRQGLHSVSSKGMPTSHISALLSVFLSGDQGSLSRGIPMLSNKRKCSMRVQARKSSSESLRYPALTEKPEWWWRSLACVPYLISLQISDTGFYVQPLLNHFDKFEDLIYFIPGAVKRWSIWLPMLYCYFSFIGVVKNKEWPHFFRYHLIMAMLLETALQVVWHMSNFMPLIHFNGTFGMYYWAAVAFIYIFLSLECIRCALGGKYVKIPFVSEAALIHTLYHVGGFYRPF